MQLGDRLDRHDFAADEAVNLADRKSSATIVEAGKPLRAICDAAGLAPVVFEHANGAAGAQLHLLGLCALLAPRLAHNRWCCSQLDRADNSAQSVSAREGFGPYDLQLTTLCKRAVARVIDRPPDVLGPLLVNAYLM